MNPKSQTPAWIALGVLYVVALAAGIVFERNRVRITEWLAKRRSH